MNIVKIVLLTVLLLGLAGCSARSSVPSKTVQVDVNSYMPSKENALLYLIRNADFREGAVSSTFYIDDAKIGTIGNEDAYFIVELEPGTYSYKRVKEDIFGANPPIKRRIRASAGVKKMFIIEGGFGSEGRLSKEAYVNHKFLGYQHISK